MSIPISIRIPSGEVDSIRQRLQQRIADARSQLVQSATNAVLTDIIEHVHVQSGQTRQEWESEQARIQGTLPVTPSQHVSQQSVTNTVDHVVYLEYGTSHMQPRSTVRPALAKLQSWVQSMFRLNN